MKTPPGRMAPWPAIGGQQTGRLGVRRDAGPAVLFRRNNAGVSDTASRAKLVLMPGIRNAHFCRTGSTKREATKVEISWLTHNIEVILFIAAAACAGAM
ncbi:MAG: hypothetical protein E2O36_08610 [Proteobacteria bacterium]|nr:MAG: hypothetical protein E2O36_08610 [Pseudomonadota bacterium]